MKWMTRFFHSYMRELINSVSNLMCVFSRISVDGVWLQDVQKACPAQIGVCTHKSILNNNQNYVACGICHIYVYKRSSRQITRNPMSWFIAG